MKRLLIVVVLALAAWQAYERYPGLMTPKPQHRAIVVNQSPHPVERLRLTVAGQTFVAETLDRGGEVRFGFRVRDDAAFRMAWQWGDTPGEFEWSGGRATVGPIVSDHRIVIRGPNDVVYFVQPAKSP